jgi:hypothetical protein
VLWRGQLESGEGETKHENAGDCDGRAVRLHQCYQRSRCGGLLPGRKDMWQLLSLETIAERVARSPRAVLISNAEVPNAYLLKEASGFIAGYLTAINVDYARHGGIGSVIDIVQSIRNLRRSGRSDELVPTKSPGRYC